MNKGSSQKSRKNRALNPKHVSIDERTMIEMLYFTLDFAQNVNFYNFQNNVSGSWKTFLLNDPSFITAMIASTDTSTFKLNEENPGFQLDEGNYQEKTEEIIEKIYGQIATWADLLNKVNYKGSLITEIEKSIQSSDKIISEVQNGKDENFIHAYEDIYGSFVFIKEQALKQLDSELKSSGHHPHVGLLLAFLELFKNVQRDINLITKKHLDFYFLELLKKQKKDPESLSAIVALHLQPGANNFEIQKGQTFEITFGENLSIPFEAVSNTSINNAEIAEIKTLYKSDYYPFGNAIDKELFSINIIYENTILNDEIDLLSQKVVEPDNYPATLGEVKSYDMFSGNLTNQSDVGILVTSPALILEKGKQNVRIQFKITPASYRQSQKLFDAFIYQEMVSLNKDVHSGEKLRQKIISQFYENAFLVFITDKDGWKQVEFLKTKMNPDDCSLVFEIPLTEQYDKLIPFDHKIHAGDFESEWPCIKFIMNNNAQYYPYKILRDIVLEEIKIEATVSEVTNLKLSNSTGNLDNSIPFTPFGVAPVIGNYLRIQNPLILQKNLSYLELNINWGGLPQLRNGFENYYRAYPEKWKIKISKQ